MDISILISKGVQSLKSNGHISLPNGSSGFSARRYNGEDFSSATQSTVICSFQETGYLTEEEKDIYLSELKNWQMNSGANKGSWCREERSSVWATSKSLLAFLTISPNSIQESFIISALEWLLDQRNPDGGWGYKKGSYSRPYYTYFVMMAKILAYKYTSDDRLRRKLKESLDNDVIFLMSLHVGSGKWKNAREGNICPASTLIAFCALKKYDEMFNSNYFGYESFEEGINYVREYIFEEPNTVWKEDNLNWNLEFFLPGKMDFILEIFDVSDDVVQSIIKRLRNSYIVDSGNFGWGLKGEDIIYTWTTALAVKSLSVYLEELKKQEIEEIEEIETRIIDKMHNEIIILKKWFKIVFLLLCCSMILNILLGVIIPYHDKITGLLSEMGITVRVILLTIIGVMILSVIGEFTKKWLSRFMHFIGNYLKR